MLSYKHLIDYALSDECMDLSLDDASERKRKRPEVKYILEHKEEEKKKLRNKIINNELELYVHQAKRIADKTSGKIRTILEPYFSSDKPEQWLHHIVINSLKPLLTKGMYEFTFGSVPGRGNAYGKKYVEKFIAKNPKEIKYALQLDIRHFYQNVNPEILKQRFDKVIRDKEFLKLVYYILDSNTGQFPDGEMITDGLPIGFYTSQWFANYFLQPFDHFVKEDLKIIFYARNMDDMVFFGRNKRELHKKFQQIKEYLTRLGLPIKPNYQVFRFDYIDRKDGKRKGRPIDFVGYKFYRDKVTLRKKNFKAARRKALKIKRKGRINWYTACQMVSYAGMFKDTNTYCAFKKHISSNVDIELCKKIISIHSKKQNKKE